MGLDGAAQEVRRFARQRPLVFVGAAAAAGFLIGRTLKNASAAQSSGSTGGNGYSTGYSTRPLAGADPYAAGGEIDLSVPSQPVTTQTPGSTLGTEYTPLAGDLSDTGVSRPSEGLR
jgi:hypothetical protein